MPYRFTATLQQKVKHAFIQITNPGWYGFETLYVFIKFSKMLVKRKDEAKDEINLN